MLTIVLIMLSGVVVGVLLRGKNMKFLPRIISVLIYALLLLLGVSVGSNPDITDNLATIGLRAVVLTIFAVAGSAVAALIIYRRFFKERAL